MTRKSKAKQERYTDKQRLDWLEQRDDVFRTVGRKWIVVGTRREFSRLRPCIDAAIRIESKLVRVRSKPKSKGGGK